MLSNIPPEITIGSFSLVGVLAGYIWNSQSKRFGDIEKIQNKLPCNSVCIKIEAIQTDIQWIKEELRKNRY